MGRILITGATSIVGRQVAAHAVGLGTQVRALVRNPDSAGLPPQVEVMRGDLTIAETLDPCLDGVDAVFLIWTAPPTDVAQALERMAKRVKRIVFLSAPIKTQHPFFQQPNSARALAGKIEQIIETSRLEFTLLRPGMFAANALRWWAPQIRAGATVRWPYLSVATAPIHERDIAAIAVQALCTGSHAGADYVLTGPESLTQSQQLAIISRTLGSPLHIEEISADEARRELAHLIPPMLLDAWAAAIGIPRLRYIHIRGAHRIQAANILGMGRRACGRLSDFVTSIT